MSKYEQFTNDDSVDGHDTETSNDDNKEVVTQLEEVNEINFEIAKENGKVPSPTDFQIPEIETVKSFKNGGYKSTKIHTPTFDQIEIEIRGGGSNEDESENASENVLTNANDFFLEHNENYQMTWAEASQRVSDGDDPMLVAGDPSKPPTPGWNKPYVLWRTRRIIESIWFRIFTVILILVDVTIVIIDLTYPTDQHNMAFLILDLFITVYFVIEIAVRIVVLTKQVFFSEWFNVVDFAVVLITLITSVAVVAAVGEAKWAKHVALVMILRLVRLVRLVRVFTEKKQVEISARQLISQNKRRYQQDGYDLDLTYVTPNIIATSFPSKGFWAYYRNPIGHVAKFLNDKHTGKYRMYNLCSERTYDTSLFGGDDVVQRFMIDDHNVPSLSEMVRFSQNVKEWLTKDPENVIVVHCKGGKGRTGTMICVWLVEAGIFKSAETSLDYFGGRRTDTNVGKKFQGVETPSQSRYVKYYEMLSRNNLELPGPSPLIIKEIIIHGMMYVGKGNGEDFWVNIDQGRSNQVYSAHFGYQRNCQVTYDSESDCLKVDLINCPSLDGDIRVLFQTYNPSVPKGYEKCPFYFWFNTALLESDKLCLKREDLDNPHKSKTWHCFGSKFEVEVHFQRK